MRLFESPEWWAISLRGGVLAGLVILGAAWALRSKMAVVRDGSRIAIWLPLLVWLVFMGFLSGPLFSLRNTALFVAWPLHRAMPSASPHTIYQLHEIVRKAVHFIEYGLLFLLLAHGPARGRNSLALVLCVLVAALDEGHQAFLQSRTGSLGDAGLDIGGAVMGSLAEICLGRAKAAEDRNQ